MAIHYAGKDEDVVFFSMDLLERSLNDVLANGKPAAHELIIKVGMDVASALQFAHTHEGGIVHRDLKPENILFDRHGNAVVTDFGIAEAATNYTSATGTTVYVGTPKYMSPEQARGQRVDHRSDIYSLGVTLYELATGAPPFAGRDWFELGRKHIEELPALPRERNPALDANLELIILKCLQKSPLERYQSAEQLRSDLAALANGTPPPVIIDAPSNRGREVTPVSRTPRESPVGSLGGPFAVTTKLKRRRRRKSSLVPLSIIMLLGGLLGAYAYNVGELRTTAEQEFPVLSALPYVGSGLVYPTAFWFETVEGGADVEPRLDLRFSGPIDPSTANSSNVHLAGPDGYTIPVEIMVADGARRISIRPTRRLQYETRYELAVGPGMLSSTGEPIHASARAHEAGATFSFVTRLPPPDVDPPVVAESFPADNSDQASPEGPITVTFSEPLNPTTVTSETLWLQDEAGERVGIRVFTAEDARSAQVQPSAPLRRRARYALIVTSRITDRAGNAALPDTLSFTVGPEAAPAGRPRPAMISVRVQPIQAAPLIRLVIDGRDTTNVPNLDLRVQPGRHHLELLGSPPYSAYHVKLHDETFTLVPGESREITPQVPPFGWVTVTSEPVADVFIDGVLVATTPLAGYALPAGPHKLELRPTPESTGRAGVYSSQVNVPRFQELNLGRVRLPPRAPNQGGNTQR